MGDPPAALRLEKLIEATSEFADVPTIVYADTITAKLPALKWGRCSPHDHASMQHEHSGSPHLGLWDSNPRPTLPNPTTNQHDHQPL